MAKKVFLPSEDQRVMVGRLLAGGIRQDGIAAAILNPETGKPISMPTFRRVFREEIKHGADVALGRVVKSLFEKAESNSAQAVQAAAFIARTRMGWKETIVNENRNFDDPESRALGDAILGRLIPELASRGAQAALGQTQLEGAAGPAIPLALLGETEPAAPDA
jgi:hypothetical protein